MFGITNWNKKVTKMPPVLTEPENPVNYNSVLDYLVGLSRSEYDKMLRVSSIYRKANKDAAKVLGVKDEPTTALKEDQPDERDIDAALDKALAANVLEFEDDTPEAKPNTDKPQAISKDKKVNINKA